jgi:hypothetical protein
LKDGEPVTIPLSGNAADAIAGGDMMALVDDFRTAIWSGIIKYPELVYQQSEQLLQSKFIFD